MKRMRKIYVSLTCLLAAASVFAAPVEKPVVLPEAMLSVTVPDFHRFIDEVGVVSGKVSPMMNGMFFKSMIGSQVNDPFLAGIPQGGGLSIVALDPTNIFAVVEVSAAQSTNYLSAVRQQGLQADYADGALLLALKPEALARGRQLAGSVQETLLGQSSSALHIAMQPAAILERNREAIDGFMQALPALMGQGLMQQPGATLESAQGISQLLEAELRVFRSLADQCEAAEIVLAPESGAVRITETFTAVAGTPLATLLSTPAKESNAPKVHAGALGDATMLFDFQVSNYEALGTFIAAEAADVIEDMQLTGTNSTEWIEAMQKWFAIYSGDGCEAVTLSADGKMGVNYVMGITDEAAALEVLRSMCADFEPLLGLYEALGMPMSLEFSENVSETNGLAIHRLVLNMDVASMPADQKQQMEQMGLEHMVYDLAITDGLMLCSDEGGIPALLKRVKEGSSAEPIAARRIYPEGGFYYFDLNTGEYMNFVAQTMPDDPSTAMMKQQMGTLFRDVAPITSAGFSSDDSVMITVTIPGDLIARLGQMGMMMQMQAPPQSRVEPTSYPASSQTDDTDDYVEPTGPEWAQAKALGELVISMAPKSYMLMSMNGGSQSMESEQISDEEMKVALAEMEEMLKAGIDQNAVHVEGYSPSSIVDLGGAQMMSTGDVGHPVPAEKGGISLIEYCRRNELTAAAEILSRY